MGMWQGLLAFVLLFTCALLIIVILLQRGRGGGLVGAFGGAGGTSAFGAKTGDVFTWITVVVAAVFVLLSIAANFVFDQSPRAGASPAEATAPNTTPATEGQEVPGLPIKVEPVTIDPATGAVMPKPQTEGAPAVDKAQGAAGPGSAESKPAPSPVGEAKPPVSEGGPAEPKKEEEAPKSGGADKPTP